MPADTISLDPGYQETICVYDRLYQKLSLDKGIYLVPIDEDEQERLNIEDDVVNGILEHALFLRPVPDPKIVLDCGYGLAEWAIAVAERYPECEVIGIDIHPLNNPDIPDNLTLECDDLNQSLAQVYPLDAFDVVQSRFVGAGIHKNRWSSYILDMLRQASPLLKPGGTLQVLEYYYNFQSDSGALTPDHALYQWGSAYRRAMQADRDPRVGSRLQELLQRAGFVDIEQRCISVPVGSWPHDAKQQGIGERNLAMVDRLLDSHGMYPLVKRLGTSMEEVLKMTARAREEARDTRLKLYLPLYVVWGRRSPSMRGA